MASRKKEATGISLLSMYNDEDEEMEDAESESDEIEYVKAEDRLDDVELVTGDKNLSSNGNKQVDADMNDKKDYMNFVDYGHDEVAMSPEAVEEGEIDAAGRDTRVLDTLGETGDGQQKDRTTSTTVRLSSSQVILTASSVQIQASLIIPVDEDICESNGVEGRDDKSQADVDPLDLFLPPPPEEKCSQELQDKINKFLALKKSGKSFNKEVRNKKAYRNPDFLLHAVTYQEIDQIGSCFSKDVFDPHGYDKSDFYDEIEADMKRELEKKNNQKVEFVAGVQPGMVRNAPKPTLPNPVPNLVVGGSSSLDAVPREGRQNKKSKWDKVDGDQVAHATLLSANSAGAGYTAFAQQRRRESEEKKSSERRRSRS